VHFFPQKVDDFFSSSLPLTFKRTLNVQTSKQRGKNLGADRRGPLGPCDGGPSHGTTGTMDNPALDRANPRSAGLGWVGPLFFLLWYRVSGLVESVGKLQKIHYRNDNVHDYKLDRKCTV